LETYDIKKLYIEDENDHSWQETIMQTHQNTVVVKAPRKTGKSYACRREIIDCMQYYKEGCTLLYFTPKHQDDVRMAYGVQILMGLDNSTVCNRTSNNIYVTEQLKRHSAVYIPADEIALAKLVASGITFDEIIIDDAERMNASLLHNAVLKAAVDGAFMTIMGSNVSYDAADSKKSVWQWMVNSPSSDTYVVEYSASNSMDFDEDKLLGIFAPSLSFPDVA